MTLSKTKLQIVFLIGFSSFLVAPLQHARAEKVTGGGYSVEQIISPTQNAVSGNGYIVNQSSQVSGAPLSGGGYSLTGSLVSPAVTVTTQPVTSPGRTNGGGFYVLPPSVTGQPVASTSLTVPIVIPNPTSTSSPFVPGDVTLSDFVSTCQTRITFSSPIDIGLSTNKAIDVKRLELFLNTYENENLPVNGIYEARDIAAVKRWQLKYKTFILDPMQLKNPTGTIYTLSMRQIERQTTKACGAPIVVTACPLFRSSLSYGDRGEDVRKVQQFLNVVQGEKLPLSGVFGPLTRDAVKRFQKSYKIYVATYIPFSFATGNWFTTTRVKANETIGCDILK